jgi:MoaA/NifB/PqqE/SkfB family radical SAM enzyme
MPINVGNVLDTPLVKLYYGSDFFCALRDEKRISDGCQRCFHAKQCRGGLKCLSYATNGNPFNADPGCWIKSAEQIDTDTYEVSKLGNRDTALVE